MDETQSSNIPRKYLSAKEKFAIVKEQLTTKIAVTEICKKHSIVASQYYRWQEQFFEGALAGFSTNKRGGTAITGRLEKELEDKNREIERMREVVLEIAAENVQLKKSPGALSTTR